MLARMSSVEVARWQAYEQETGPLGAERDDILAAMTAYYVMQALGAKKVKLSKLIPQWAPRRPQPWQSMKRALMALTTAAGGEITGTDDT